MLFGSCIASPIGKLQILHFMDIPVGVKYGASQLECATCCDVKSTLLLKLHNSSHHLAYIVPVVGEEEKKIITTQAVKTTPHIDEGKESHFGTEYRKAPLLCEIS